ncbi:MAG: threonine dehydratase [Arcticibacterium sp.]
MFAYLDLYSKEAIVAEPAGVLSVASLADLRDEIKGTNVVYIHGDGNNGILRMEEIREGSSIFEGLKHYVIICLPSGLEQ